MKKKYVFFNDCYATDEVFVSLIFAVVSFPLFFFVLYSDSRGQFKIPLITACFFSGSCFFSAIWKGKNAYSLRMLQNHFLMVAPFVIKELKSEGLHLTRVSQNGICLNVYIKKIDSDYEECFMFDCETESMVNLLEYLKHVSKSDVTEADILKICSKNKPFV